MFNEGWKYGNENGAIFYWIRNLILEQKSYWWIFDISWVVDKSTWICAEFWRLDFLCPDANVSATTCEIQLFNSRNPSDGHAYSSVAFFEIKESSNLSCKMVRILGNGNEVFEQFNLSAVELLLNVLVGARRIFERFASFFLSRIDTVPRIVMFKWFEFMCEMNCIRWIRTILLNLLN